VKPYSISASTYFTSCIPRNADGRHGETPQAMIDIIDISFRRRTVSAIILSSDKYIVGNAIHGFCDLSK
jgi:hypothetical protein